MNKVDEQRGCVPVLSDSQARGHGGSRLKGVHGRSAFDHDAVTDKYLQASMWFLREKEIHADQAPNPNPGEKGIYQIDKMFTKDYYSSFVSHMKEDRHLADSDIASYGTWKRAWKTDHADLVMRVQKNVDSKDRVNTPCAYILPCIRQYTQRILYPGS